MAGESPKRSRSQKASAPAGLAELRADLVKGGRGRAMDGSRIGVDDWMIPTGIFHLDYAFLGGIQEGQVTMFLGLPSAHKTTIALKTIAGLHRKYPDKWAVLVDAEDNYDQKYSQDLGIDTDRLEVIKPFDGPTAVDALEAALRVPEVGLVVLDSIPACSGMQVLTKSAEDASVSELATIMSRMASKITSTLVTEKEKGHLVSVILLNQFRSKIGVMFGNPLTSPGGYFINHLATRKIVFRSKPILQSTSLDEKAEGVAQISFTVEKSKFGGPVRAGEFFMSHLPQGYPVMNPSATKESTRICVNRPYLQGEVIEEPQVVQLAVKYGLLSGAGANMSCPLVSQEKMSKTQWMLWLRDHPEKSAVLKANLVALYRAYSNRQTVPVDGYLLGVGKDRILPEESLRKIIANM